MAQESEHSSGTPKRLTLIGAGVVAICAVVYFSYHSSAPGVDDVAGTIGAADTPTSGHPFHKNVNAKTEGQNAHARVFASDAVIMELKDTAVALGGWAQALAGRSDYDRGIVMNLAGTAVELEKAAQFVLNRQISMEESVAVDLRRQAAGLNRTAEQAVHSPQGKPAAAEFLENARILERAAMAVQPLVGRSAVGEFRRTSSALDRIAKDLERGANSDRTLIVEFQKTAEALERAARYYDREDNMNPVVIAGLLQQTRELDRRATAFLDAMGGSDRFATAEFGRLARTLQKQTEVLERSDTVARGREVAAGN